MKLNKITTFKEFKKLNESTTGTVRVRFAPSPTGPLHIGGVRTALYNYLFAKKYNGVNILRIEDTDRSRYVPSAEKYIVDSLTWLGIEFDEGPHVGGPYGPYRQSERKDIYNKYYKELINNGKAYYAFDTEEDMNKLRDSNPHFSYDINTRKEMINSLTLQPEEVEKMLSERNDWVVRIKFEPDEIIVVNDLIRGKITVNTNTLDDKVIYKAKDGLPTYHLANIIDDHFMKITHVIRGEEWIPSAPLHVYLYQCFGWDSPQFAHLPLILNPDGQGKLSKRHGDKYGFPVFPMDWTVPENGNKIMGYKEQGYTPNAVVNLLAFLGWNPGTDKEIYTMDDLIRDFSLNRVQKAGARFNIEKAKWFNSQHLKNMKDEDLVDDFTLVLKEKGIELPYDKVLQLIKIGKGKSNFVTEIYDNIKYFFEKPEITDLKTFRKKWDENSSTLMVNLGNLYEQLQNWDKNNIKIVFEQFVNDNGLNFGNVMPPLRLVITGVGFGSDIFEMMELIGKEQCVERLLDANNIKK